MPAEALIDRAVVDIADGNSVDWDLLDSQARDEEERKQLKWLRVLEEIANLHRSSLHEDEDASESAASEDDSIDTTSLTAVASESSTPGAPAQTWGRFQLREKVGEGSFGRVYRAWDPQLEREIAIKILHRHLTDNRLRDRLLREGRALAKIRQANVVSVFAVESQSLNGEGERVGLCMEFVRGQTLEDVLRHQGTLSARETVLVGEDVCRALAAVHNAGFVHRDVKARNVMREQAGRIVLMDFGTGREARVLEEAKRPDVAGTPLYMAPEVLAGEPASARSDVYSVGVLLYHLVTAAYPVTSGSIDDLREAHRQGHRRFLSECRPDLPTAFVRVVERSLAADPEQRYANAGALLAALGDVLGDPEKATITLPTLTVPRWALTLGQFAAGAAVVPFVLGMLTSVAYNLTLMRTDFSTDRFVDWWVWGLKSLVLPFAMLVVTALVVVVPVIAWRIARRLSSTAITLHERVRGEMRVLSHRLGMDQPPTLAGWVLVGSTIAAGAVISWYAPLIMACTTWISNGSAEVLSALAPDFKKQHVQYRQMLSLLLIATMAAWWLVLRMGRRRQQPVSHGSLIAGVAVIAVLVVLLEAPYRLLRHNEAEVVNWEGHRCHVLGERADKVLLVCAGMEPPRKHVVQIGTAPIGKATIQHTGLTESPYAGFSPAALQRPTSRPVQ